MVGPPVPVQRCVQTEASNRPDAWDQDYKPAHEAFSRRRARWFQEVPGTCSGWHWTFMADLLESAKEVLQASRQPCRERYRSRTFCYSW